MLPPSSRHDHDPLEHLDDSRQHLDDALQQLDHGALEDLHHDHSHDDDAHDDARVDVAPHASPSAPPIPRSGPILAVGDSVMLGASTELDAALGPELHIDAVVSRQPEATIARLFAYRAEGSLPRRVIVHIGDNGPVYWADIERLRAALAGVPLVVIVSVRVDTSWQSEVNGELLAAVKSWPQATMANWYAVSGGPGLLADGTHTTPQGAQLFASVIAAAIHHPRFRGIAPP